MANKKLENYNEIVIGTGNILKNDEFKKATTPTSEVSIYFPHDFKAVPYCEIRAISNQA